MAIEIKEYEGHVAKQMEDNKKAGDKSLTKKPAKKTKEKKQSCERRCNMAGRGRSFVRKSSDTIKQPKVYMADGLKFKSKSLYDLYYLLKELQKEKLITCFELPTLTEQKQYK